MKKKFGDARFTIDMEETGKRLKTFRILRNLTLAELSELSGLSMAMISESETGKNKPSPNLMYAMNRLYNMNINWLLTGEGEMVTKKSQAKQPPRNEKGELVYDMDSLLWYMERVPIVRYSVLGFFSGFYFENKKTIEKFLKETEEENNGQTVKGGDEG